MAIQKLSKKDILYHAWVNLEPDKDEKSTIEFEEWHVTHVDKRGYFFRRKCCFTWGKVSHKHGDYGWLPISPADKRYYTKFCTHEEIAEKTKEWLFFKSQSAAYNSVMPELRKALRDVNRLINQVNRKIKQTKK